MLWSPVSGLYSCPLAMTDGAAKTAEANGLLLPDDAKARLTSRDPERFWTSGQWMTEPAGGSDVSAATATTGAWDANAGCYRLSGYKWFSSATDSDMALTLARIVESDNSGLSMFYLRTRDDDGSLNGIQVHK